MPLLVKWFAGVMRKLLFGYEDVVVDLRVGYPGGIQRGAPPVRGGLGSGA